MNGQYSVSYRDKPARRRNVITPPLLLLPPPPPLLLLLLLLLACGGDTQTIISCGVCWRLISFIASSGPAGFVSFRWRDFWVGRPKGEVSGMAWGGGG